LCDLRVLKRFTPAAQGEKTHFSQEKSGVLPLATARKLLASQLRAAQTGRRTKADRRTVHGCTDRRLDLIGRCHNMPV